MGRHHVKDASSLTVAKLIQRVIYVDPQTDESRAYVSQLWAEDWNCEEDNVYNESMG